MKKVIVIGAALLALTGTAAVVASNYCCEDNCPVGVCKPGDKCPIPADCCKK
jgi:hypothetical protein